MIATSRPSTEIFERKRMRWVGHRGLMEIEKIIGLEKSCRKTEAKYNTEDLAVQVSLLWKEIGISRFRIEPGGMFV